ncbi:Protein CIP2A [Nymphon striatum]|nr:Protein CIP2A [Nymphon striatum]
MSLPGYQYFSKITCHIDEHYKIGELYMEFVKDGCTRKADESCAICSVWMDLATDENNSSKGSSLKNVIVSGKALLHPIQEPVDSSEDSENNEDILLETHDECEESESNAEAAAKKQILKNSTLSSSWLSELETNDLTSAEFFTSIIDLLNCGSLNFLISVRLLELINNLISEAHIRNWILCHYPLLSALSQHLLHAFSQKQESVCVQCISLLESCSSNIDINSKDQYIPHLLEFLIAQIVENPSSKLFETCIYLLKNLTRNSIVQAHIKTMNKFKLLGKVLIRQLPGSNHLIAISSLSILTNLLFNDPLGQTLFGENSIQNTFHFALSILLQSSNNFSALTVSVDVITQIISSIVHCDIIVKTYRDLKKALKTLLTSLKSYENYQCTEKIMEFLRTLWNNQQIKDILRFCESDICCCSFLLNCCCQWISHSEHVFSKPSFEALELLHHLYMLIYIIYCGKRGSAKEHFLTNRVVKYWNKIPNQVKCVDSVEKFKNQLDKYKHTLEGCELNEENLNNLCAVITRTIDIQKLQLKPDEIDDVLNTVFMYISIIGILQEHNIEAKNILQNILQNEVIIPYFVMGLRCTDSKIIHILFQYLPMVIQYHTDKKTKLNKLQKETADKLNTALDARNDKIADRLRDDVANELWIEEKVPKWHKKSEGFSNLTDVIVLAVYYYKTKLKELGLDEFWMKTQQDSHLPIHKIANTLDADLCRALPLIHSLSGRDITSYPFFIGKTTWLQKSKAVPLDYIASYAEAEDDYSLTEDVIDQARQLFIAVYSSSSNELSQLDSLAELRAHKFLKSNATDLKRLPSTEDAFLLHLERSAYACIIDKTAHIANPVIPEPTEYGWISEGDNMIPHQMRNPSWPADAAKATNCSCKKGCQRSCSCSKASRRCNIDCLCRGHPDTCKRARLQELENESSDEESSGSSEGDLED